MRWRKYEYYHGGLVSLQNSPAAADLQDDSNLILYLKWFYIIYIYNKIVGYGQ